MILGIMGNLRKPSYRKSLPAVIAELRKRNAKFVVDAAASNGLSLNAGETAVAEELADKTSLIVSFGGDGTLLRTARTIGNRGIPILGVNLGPGLGYLTEMSLDEFLAALDPILGEQYRVEERMMLKADINGGSAPLVMALNDITVGHSQISRTTQLQVMIDGKPVTTYRCDGLIVSTPTGSTAYSLSAGGPIVEPTLNVVLVTPICPHTLTMRPVVISAKRTLEIKSGENAVLAADGETIKSLKAGDVIRVTRAPYNTLIASVTGHDFYHVLRAKLKWGTAQLEG
jgi:NAD+ kinase